MTESVKTQDRNNKKSFLTGRTFLFVIKIYDGADVVGYVLFFSGQADVCYYAGYHSYDKEGDAPHNIQP